MATGSQSSGMYGLGKYPLQHYVPLWIIVVFLFAVVVLCTMAGLQEGLGKRHFGDARVKGDLEVTGSSRVDGGSSNPTGVVAKTLSSETDFELIPANTAFALRRNRTYRFATDGNAQTLTLPTGASNGDVVQLRAHADSAGGNLIIDCGGSDSYHLGSSVFITGLGGAATGSFYSMVTAPTTGQTLLTITNTGANQTIGIGSIFNFTYVAGNRWLVDARITTGGNATAIPSGAFAA